MTFLRVLKWISLIVSILAIALCGVGHGFVIADMNICDKDDSNNVLMGDIKKALADYDDVISGFFGKDSKSKDNAAEEPVASVSEATDSEAVEEDSEEANADTVSAVVGAYTLDGKNEIIATVMKYASATFNFGKLKFNLPVLGDMEYDITCNASFFVSVSALILASLFNFITRANKSFYGYILMIVGLLFFIAYVVLSNLIAIICLDYFAPSLSGNDFAFYRFLFIIAFNAFFLLFSALPIYRCGVRQINSKRLKKRIAAYQRKLQRKAS